MDDSRLIKLTQENAGLKKELVGVAVELERRNRQLEIEAALDNVRLRAGAMRSSEELGEASAVLFQQLNELGIQAIRTAVGIFDDPNEAMELWLTSHTGGGETDRMLYYFSLHIHPVFENIVPARQAGKPYALTVLSGRELRSYYQTMSTYLSASRQQSFNETEYFYSFFFSGGTINVVANQPVAEEQCTTMIRVAQVFGLLYTRFLDLQKAEANVKEAQVESALERVRARAQAMQNPEELNDVIQFFRNEMGVLGENELETSQVYVYEEKTGASQCWFATESSRSAADEIVSGEFELNLQDTWLGREMLKFFQSEGKEICIAVEGDNHKEWVRYCDAKCKHLRGSYCENIPDRSYHFYKFSGGAMARVSSSLISQENWDMLKRAASVFSLAYSRFKDLTRARMDWQNLKEEKSRAENALAELKVTQRQLIQSEKMASLGELTAGIAHEIQNPLNFVNNFSETNKELIEELQVEVQNGNVQQAMTIAADIKANEEKIAHHGKRAESIVKGMLQHARASTGKKELIDINKLADEYFRLSYQGMRVKDKTFNASVETHFDETVGAVSVVPQEIGHVLLNLFNNAFYAVAEKSKLQQNGYEPRVQVETRAEKNKALIFVRDNGPGIPSTILDKIFQPFFTTKPTGQGTGLGLSLSYDIITKGHDGELSVTTAEGKGTEFVIMLPTG